MRRLSAFTITELIVVLVIVAIMAGLLFPVVATTKQAALRASCLAHFRQVAEATHLYADDYDDLAVPINHNPGQSPNPVTDQTWVQMLLPYAPSFQIYECPADTSETASIQATFDKDLVPGDIYSEYYTASLRSNVGYNFEYLAPVFKSGGVWYSDPQSLSSLSNPAKMVLYVDSAWSVVNGVPTGGGSWLVSPPCRYEESYDDQKIDTIGSVAPAAIPARGRHGPVVFAPLMGWSESTLASSPFGGAWPWHNGKTNMCSVEGSARSLTMDQLSEGCYPLPAWNGIIYDRASYLWSPK